jgi:hypothetical protein
MRYYEYEEYVCFFSKIYSKYLEAFENMKNIKDSCIEFFNSENIRKEVREIIKPIVNIIYNEIYVYIWFICFYNVFLIFIILANLFLLLRLLAKNNRYSNIDN